MIIRSLTAEDVETTATWLAQTPLMQRYGMTLSGAERGLLAGLDHEDLMLVAEDHQVDALAWVQAHGVFGQSPYLKLLMVRDGNHGKGIGQSMMQEVEAMLRVFARDLFLLTSDFNSGAQRFYARLGYQHIGAIPGYVLPDVTELIYWKRL